VQPAAVRYLGARLLRRFDLAADFRGFLITHQQ
jgi:hypothetical protein